LGRFPLSAFKGMPLMKAGTTAVSNTSGDVGVAGSFEPDDDDPSQPKTPPFDGDGDEASAIF
jgi:hypothetical protein